MPRLRKFVVGLFLMLAPLLLALAILYGVASRLDATAQQSDLYIFVVYACIVIVAVYIAITCVVLLVLIVRLIESGCNMVISACQGRGSQETTEEAVERNN